jgi:hypothetical protein
MLRQAAEDAIDDVAEQTAVEFPAGTLMGAQTEGVRHDSTGVSHLLRQMCEAQTKVRAKYEPGPGADPVRVHLGQPFLFRPGRAP